VLHTHAAAAAAAAAAVAAVAAVASFELIFLAIVATAAQQHHTGPMSRRKLLTCLCLQAPSNSPGEGVSLRCMLILP
jgi:hypothetical protein